MMGDSDVQVIDFNGFVDLVRRTQTPWYEEAHPYWQTEHTQHWLWDANQVAPYPPHKHTSATNRTGNNPVGPRHRHHHR